MGDCGERGSVRGFVTQVTEKEAAETAAADNVSETKVTTSQLWGPILASATGVSDKRIRPQSDILLMNS